MPLLPGTDGNQKMSKSLGNYVGLSEDALTMYSKLEKVSDANINQYFELLTDLPLDQLPESPRERQKLLALEVVSQYPRPAGGPGSPAGGADPDPGRCQAGRGCARIFAGGD